MKTLLRNQREFSYCLYVGEDPIIDDYGNETGEYRVTYGLPQAMKANISPATGTSGTEQFGNLEDYDKVIVHEGVCPFDENAVLFIDKAPEFDGEGDPLPDYRVRRIAQSINSWSAAVGKIKVS